MVSFHVLVASSNWDILVKTRKSIEIIALSAFTLTISNTPLYQFNQIPEPKKETKAPIIVRTKIGTRLYSHAFFFAVLLVYKSTYAKGDTQS